MSLTHMRRVTVLVVVMLVAITTVLVQPTDAGQVAPAEGTGNTQAAEFVYQGENLGCEVEEYSITSFNVADDEIDEDAVGLSVDVTGDGLVTFSVSNLASGQYVFNRTCSDNPAFDRRVFEFNRVVLTKSVVGEVPADTSFTVQVDCDFFDDGPGLEGEERTFGETGGTAQVVIYEAAALCTVTEPQDGGAQQVDIAPETLDFDGFVFGDGSSTVTNTFVAPDPSPSPSPSPTPEPEPEPVVDDSVEEAEPAEPIEAEPDFTG